MVMRSYNDYVLFIAKKRFDHNIPEFKMGCNQDVNNRLDFLVILKNQKKLISFGTSPPLFHNQNFDKDIFNSKIRPILCKLVLG